MSGGVKESEGGSIVTVFKVPVLYPAPGLFISIRLIVVSELTTAVASALTKGDSILTIGAFL